MKNKYKLDYKINPESDCVKYVKSYNEKNFTSHNYSDKIIRADFCKTLISIIFKQPNLWNIKRELTEILEILEMNFKLGLENKRKKQNWLMKY